VNTQGESLRDRAISRFVSGPIVPVTIFRALHLRHTFTSPVQSSCNLQCRLYDGAATGRMPELYCPGGLPPRKLDMSYLMALGLDAGTATCPATESEVALQMFPVAALR
jgi:hypothetical protein